MSYGVIPTFLTAPALSTAALDATKTKLQIKSHSNADDGLVNDWILAAAQHFWEQTSRLPIREQLQYFLDRPPVQDKIEIPCPPLVSVDAVDYLNAEGVWTPFDNSDSPTTYPWEAQLTSGVYAPRGWIQLKSGASWPTTLNVPNAFRITFTAGYATAAADVPGLVQTVLRQIVGDFDRYRSNAVVIGSGPVEVPIGVKRLMEGFKCSALQTIVPRSCV